MRYQQRQDGEGFTVTSGEVHRIACCDCGLVHDFVFISGRGQVGIAARRNNRATSQRRRNAAAAIRKGNQQEGK